MKGLGIVLLKQERVTGGHDHRALCRSCSFPKELNVGRG